MRQIHRVKKLKGWRLHARDGEIGSFQQAYFEDENWNARYLVVRTGGWLLGRHVLIAPRVVAQVDTEAEHIVVDLAREQVEGSPPWDTEKPISRHYEEMYHRFYGWSPYWSVPGLGGMPPMVSPATVEAGRGRLPPNPHLRSSDEVTGYDVSTTDGQLGHVEDLLLDDESWRVRYLEVDTGNWWPGKKVLIAPTWIKNIRLEGREISVSVTRDTIHEAPEYDPSMLVTPDYEVRLFEYYARSAKPD